MRRPPTPLRSMKWLKGLAGSSVLSQIHDDLFLLRLIAASSESPPYTKKLCDQYDGERSTRITDCAWRIAYPTSPYSPMRPRQPRPSAENHFASGPAASAFRREATSARNDALSLLRNSGVRSTSFGLGCASGR